MSSSLFKNIIKRKATEISSSVPHFEYITTPPRPIKRAKMNDRRVLVPNSPPTPSPGEAPTSSGRKGRTDSLSSIDSIRTHVTSTTHESFGTEPPEDPTRSRDRTPSRRPSVPQISRSRHKFGEPIEHLDYEWLSIDESGLEACGIARDSTFCTEGKYWWKREPQWWNTPTDPLFSHLAIFLINRESKKHGVFDSFRKAYHEELDKYAVALVKSVTADEKTRD